MKLVVLVALAALVIWGEASPARACEPSSPAQLVDVMPANGATGVPTNAQVRLDYAGFETAGLQDVEVRLVDGAALATTVVTLGNAGYPLRNLVVARLQAPLAPQTQYEVRAGGAVVSTFRTGDGADTTPPVFAGIANVTTSATDCRDSACCGPNRIAYVHMDWGGVSDDFSIGLVRFNVYGAGGNLVVPMTSHRVVGYQVCSGQLSGSGPLGEFQGDSGRYRVRAVDLAGNEDTNDVTRDVTFSCALPQPDAGSSDGPSSPAGGCGCTTAGGSPSGLVVPMLLMLWGLRSSLAAKAKAKGKVLLVPPTARPADPTPGLTGASVNAADRCTGRAEM